jgi:hypothetical protein
VLVGVEKPTKKQYECCGISASSACEGFSSAPYCVHIFPYLRVSALSTKATVVLSEVLLDWIIQGFFSTI